MKIETVRIMYEDYKEYQAWYLKHHDFKMEETFKEYVQRCIDIDELELIE
tara:strand:- start:4297 stop:4446 length:150 start_codon:yes stop_codon:yes gene_type:complete